MIHYHTTGNGPTVVLIHGFPNDSSTWEPIIPQLQGQYRLLMPDLPGAGNSAPVADLSMKHMAEQVKLLLDQEQVDQAILVGHSMGGYTAVEFAAQYPERVAGLAMVHSLAGTDTDEKKLNREKAIRLMAKGPTEAETFLRGMAQNLFSDMFSKQHPEVLRGVVEQGMKISPQSLANFYTAIKNRMDRREVLRQANFPVQWIIGEEDSATPMKDALSQAYLAPINLVAIYKNCGHMSMLEAPQQLARDLLAFFQYCTNA